MFKNLITKMKSQKGFTLVELLIVISIIGILTAVITVSSNASRAQARDVERKANIGLVTASLESYRAEHRAYPQASNFEDLQKELFPEYLDRQISSDSNKEYKYIAPNNCLGGSGIAEGAYYAIEVKLESDRQTTFDDPGDNPCVINTYVSGQYSKRDGGDVYYRQSGR